MAERDRRSVTPRIEHTTQGIKQVGVTVPEAEFLIRLDRVASRADRSWNEWFVAVMVDYVVWSERPTATGVELDRQNGKWETRDGRTSLTGEPDELSSGLVETSGEGFA